MVHIGIDFGTTNSVVAYTADGTNPIIIPTRERDLRTPSAVTCHRDGTLLVGSTAVRYADKNGPQNTISSIKRWMGCPYDLERFYHEKMLPYRERVLQEEIARVSKGAKVGPPSYMCTLIIEKFNTDAKTAFAETALEHASDVCALIIEKLKTDAERALGEKVTHALIAAPAYYDINQREATRQAGEKAGLKVGRIVAEPIAAVFGTFEIDLDSLNGKNVMVYDFSGSHCNVSIVCISEGIPTLRHIESDKWLGGDNFDERIVDFVCDEVERYYQLPYCATLELRYDRKNRWGLNRKAERVKVILGNAHEADFIIFQDIYLMTLEKWIDLIVTVHRSDFEAWIRQDTERSIALVEQAIAAPGFTPDEIDYVLLVGGSTHIPLVRYFLAEKFGEEKIETTVDPMNRIALGAAILASRVE